MEITSLFRACVKTIRTRNKALGVPLPELDKNRILNVTKSKHSDFILKVKEVLNRITKLRDFLLEHRKAYLNFSNHLSTLPKMSDYERDKIDTEVQIIMKISSNDILKFKRDASLHEGSPQQVEHQDAIIDLIDTYLKAVCEIYSAQKALRRKRNIEVQKMSRLESEVLSTSEIKVAQGNHSSTNLVADEETNSSSDESNTRLSKLNLDTLSISSLTQEDDLTAEELQMFESENEQIYIELNSLTDEVRQIESKVVGIAKLQQEFTEKVLDQDKDIGRIYGTLVGTTENLRDANTQIRQAIQSNAGLRVYVLFFLLVMSLTLLFLDWYND